MKHWLAFFLLASMPAFAQEAPKPSAAPIQLTTTERIALQSCESAKQDLQKRWQEIMQQEQTILVEFHAAHPGYHVNSQTFAVEADQVKPALPKATTPKPALPAKK
jgi:hypothetical protein